MRWKDCRLCTKFSVGFGIVLLLLAAVAVISVFGISGITRDAGEVIGGNQLRGEMTQRKVDHLEWADKINALLTDESVTTLDVQTDPHKCDFGLWYYGEGRSQAEALVPELKQLLDSIEDPHTKLHETAIAIQKVFSQADLEMGDFLREKKTEHLSWAHKVKDVFVDPSITKIDAEMDPTQCSLGKWLMSDAVQELKAKDPTFASALSAIIEPHRHLHESAATIQDYLDKGEREKAGQYYMEKTSPLAASCLEAIDGVLAWQHEKVEGMQAANAIYATETKTHLHDVKTVLDNIIATTSANVLTDEGMLQKATTTKFSVLIFSIVAILIGIPLAIIIARGILKPLAKGIDFAQQVSEGDLTQSIDLDQKDEIGSLALALNTMVAKLQQIMLGINDAAEQVASSSEELSSSAQLLSSASTEQASSLEETSASIEELTTSVEQNADHAKETERMVMEAAKSVQEASKLTEEATQVCSETVAMAEQGGRSVQSMLESMNEISASSKRIAEIIKVIDDIADQTNLLALNAAIEAARAGEMGKGFAVVAVEVRKLAERSQTAAKEISDMITDTVHRIDQGVDLANECGVSLDKMVTGIGQASGQIHQVSQTSVTQTSQIQKAVMLVQEIASACGEQAAGALQIRQAIAQLDQVTQQNAATSEESASASEELSAQAQSMQSMVSRFQIDGNGKSGYSRNDNMGNGQKLEKHGPVKGHLVGPNELVSV